MSEDRRFDYFIIILHDCKEGKKEIKYFQKIKFKSLPNPGISTNKVVKIAISIKIVTNLKN